MTNPCGICEQRIIGCHANCEAYQAWREEQMAQKEKRQEKRTVYTEVASYNRENCEKYKRRNRKK